MLFYGFVFLVMMFMLIVFKFYFYSNHLLNMLLNLEFFSMMIFFMLMIVLWISFEKYILMYYLVFCVCEGAFGLSILVTLIRVFGNDFVSSMNILKC
uniref:NADH-ubiquinone oxidoreductase chain 4L n=2 Tax=unclassified Prolachesilla TaxID=2635580 RepID=A0A8K1ZFK4_9NEOP|nr:NADH dehydrogenase subunit 4L [Prolachesilla sp. GRAspLA]UGS80304.1 NADH dehydrogenase subunit 4L [Prolachesilla sp. GRA2sp1LA]